MRVDNNGHGNLQGILAEQVSDAAVSSCARLSGTFHVPAHTKDQTRQRDALAGCHQLENDIAGKTVHVIGAGALVVCLADKIDLDVVKGIAALKAELESDHARGVQGQRFCR